MTHLRRAALLLIALPLLVAAAACTASDSCPTCQDAVTGVPFKAGETHTYQLTQDGKDKGDFQLVAAADGDRLVLKQLSRDEKGNSDDSAVTVDAATLKAVSGTREIIDSNQRTLLESTYQPIDKGKCSSGVQVTVKKSVFKPPADTKPDSVRSVPKCLPEHAYDNDTSLFIWRSVTFEKGGAVMYRTWLTNQQTDQIVTLTVKDQERISTPSGDFDAWYVEITADQSTQRAWFATSDDHRLLRYDNANLTFLLKE